MSSIIFAMAVQIDWKKLRLEACINQSLEGWLLRLCSLTYPT